MKLHSIDIKGFRSFKERQVFFLDDRVTVLIGANDHGKSNLLEAILRLDKDRPITADDRNWDLPRGEEPTLEWFFSLTEEDFGRLGQIADRQIQTARNMEAFLPYNAGENKLVVIRKGGGPLQISGVPMKIPQAATGAVLKLIPTIDLFREPSKSLVDSIGPADLDTNLVMRGIFHLAGLWDHRKVVFRRTDDTARMLDDASQRLSEALRSQWNQGKELRWNLSHHEGRINIEINDPSISSRTSRPSRRSSGFKTFFSLSMMTLAKTAEDQGKDRIFLFDEPGTYLHPQGQIDLQRSFERISDASQVVYTTHSLFLVSKNYPTRNKVIKKSGKGSEINQKPFLQNWKMVRDSLGIMMASNLLISERTLLVEGASDVIYILQAIRSMKRNGKIDLDLNDFSIVDSRDSDNYGSLAQLMLDEGRSIVALLDGDEAGMRTKRRLEKDCQSAIGNGTLTFCMLPEGQSIEDTFVDLAFLQKAAGLAANELVSQGHKQFSDVIVNGIVPVELITPSATASLGLVFDRQTSKWFTPPRKLSKLVTAIYYEKLVDKEQYLLGAKAEEIIAEIQLALGIRGEKSPIEGVFEETSC